MSVLTLPNPDTLSVRAKALVFDDPKSQALLRRIEQLAPSDASVLLYGETGTGKEIVARHVHDLSRRRARPFVAVSCGALTESLVDSELFGREDGARSGAGGHTPGWFEAAHGGTLLLDEIGDLSPSAQVKLLRVLQAGEVVRLGSSVAQPVDVRLIAATSVPLEQAVAAGRFRADLYYRLNVASLSLLALRERTLDILPLAQHFLELYRRRLGLTRALLDPLAAAALHGHAWPGNIRELENVIHYGLLLCRDGCVTAQDLRLSTLETAGRGEQPAGAPRVESTLEDALIALFNQELPHLYQRIEHEVMRAAYRYCDRNQMQTARLLGISRNIVRARLIESGELRGSVRPPVPELEGELD